MEKHPHRALEPPLYLFGEKKYKECIKPEVITVWLFEIPFFSPVFFPLSDVLKKIKKL